MEWISVMRKVKFPMNDADLIKAVAELLGWTDLKWGDVDNLWWGAPPGETETYKGKLLISPVVTPWLTSVDAALAVVESLGPEYGYVLQQYVGGLTYFKIYRLRPREYGSAENEDKCHAILEALLEVK